MRLRGERIELSCADVGYPAALARIADPPPRLYLVGDPDALREGLAVVGARKATPYGISCAQRFAGMAAQRGVVIVSGGARGCDAAAHEAALAAGAPTVAFLGGGCDELYPAEHAGLFQHIVDAGGAIVSERPWNCSPRPYMFRLRNRLIAGLAKAVLIVEAGLPSGTFSTADEALAAGRDVLVVPGAITSASSRGANRLLYQGALPIVDDDSFADALFSLFGCLKEPPSALKDRRDTASSSQTVDGGGALVAVLRAETKHPEDLYVLACTLCGQEEPRAWLMQHLAEAELAGSIVRYPDGRWGPGGLIL
ncbi:DNA-processing protein DprA [Gordonibacter sp.]|uniref:DNA-processing protein DprA n=1 Tax=Gordonibacter sp. TaxID=1968902 RepID=UPI002FC5BBC7